MATFEELVDQRILKLIPELLKPLLEEIEQLKARPNYKQDLTPKEAMKFLNVKCHETLNNMANRGDIVKNGAGRKVTFSLSSCEAYLRKTRVRPEVIQDKLARIV